MRKFKMGLAVLATSAAVFVPTGAANADGALLEICDGPNACRDASVVEVGDVNICGLSVVEINVVLAGGQATCSKGTHQGWTVKKK